ncbi:PAAR domain-containing protein [Paraburkholderia sp.]|uniref:PAAR domain-containing protein n=1 Tax=Paraburkholderia sp. TaxID=1926495 RepID=UPI00286F77BA|nr:PAAR domain-containing protein [Paraburkholderia sp.]
MRDNVTGREVARLGDSTDHGGEVIEAATNLKHQGIPVMLHGHLVRCPKCGGDYPGEATGTRTHNGVKVMFIGDKTACGATLVRA